MKSPDSSIIVQLLRDLAAGLSFHEVSARYPHLDSAEGKQALLEAAKILEESPEETALLSEMFEQIPELVYVKEAETLTYVRFNEAAQQSMAVQAEDILGKTDYAFLADHEAASFQEMDRKVLSEGRLVEVAEQKVQTPHGLRIFHTKKLPIFGPDGKPRFLVGISRDITPMILAKEELARSQEQHRRFSAALQQGQENERTRLAQELNDELGQVLTGLKIELAWMEERADLPEHFSRSQRLINSALATVRRVATALHPQMLEQLGLHSALDWLADDLSGRTPRPVKVDYQLGRAPSPELAITIFRISQEALFHNLSQTSGSLSLSVTQALEEAQVSISLDGSLASSGPEQLSLVGISERVHLWGGTLRVDSSADSQAWRLRVNLPFESS